eukprot:Platyproteum_vivax@DN14815_c0_g1_i1.p2
MPGLSRVISKYHNPVKIDRLFIGGKTALVPINDKLFVKLLLLSKQLASLIPKGTLLKMKMKGQMKAGKARSHGAPVVSCQGCANMVQKSRHQHGCCVACLSG